MKPYLYGGIALLIVGLFSFSYSLYYQLEAATTQLETTKEANDLLNKRVVSLVLREGKKQTAAEAYIAALTKLEKLAGGLQKAAASYKDRDTENAKCLDMVPPADFVRVLDESSVRGQRDMHSSESLLTNPH